MNQLNISRLGLFIRRQAVLNVSSLWVSLGAISGVLIIITLLVAVFSPYNLESLKGLYMTVLYISGLIFTSKVFAELHKPQKAYALLTLPVSNLEKTLGAWIISSPVFIIIYLVFIFLIISISSMIVGSASALVNFFDQDTWRPIAVYMVIQPIFLLGASTFRGNNFLKTVFSIFLFNVVVSVFAGLLVYILFEGGSLHQGSVSPDFISFATDTVVPVISFMFWYLLAPFMLLVSYFKLKERQV
ncbi:MAG: hypothetical protein H0X62_00590 [Bacteroidetes bacterium]|nr:hypothetical protein [Bacteroidota bacterium]